MKKQDFTTGFVTDATPREVFMAINHVRGWWSEHIEGSTSQPDDVFIYRDKYLTARMHIVQLTPQKIVWDVVETYNTFFDHRTEWNGTQIIFEILEQEGRTAVLFTHAGLIPKLECFNVCSNSWDFFIRTSLKKLAETGKGANISKDEHSYTTSIFVDASPQNVFEAINDIAGWWSENIEGEPGAPGGELFYHYRNAHLMKLKVVELKRDEKIVWFVKDNFFDFTQDDAGLKGTKIIFAIQREGDGTRLDFTHHGLVKECACYDICKSAWDELVGESLYQRITTGKGNPVLKQKDGFDTGLVENRKLNAEDVISK
ncbi:SRPBCC domain-containing protein [Niabella pedocola]|uniref:SRPBCC domain-containing protein n=1 Tax=Niabella pedocola TaxID=1752077 RepID=A0ABS8PKB2_9BACT|nr:SRPBCC family protein [Niabella pedocola]MCD2421542.1 SRPBCC domain-containing protein [Niabella pedocola]